jgi:iron(III) transport system substrate-binding protein
MFLRFLKVGLKRSFVALAVLLLLGCLPANPSAGEEVVVYTSVDQVFAEPLLKQFEAASGVKVKAVYDVEATKTTGLVNRLIAEKGRPLADVFWSGEFVQTLLLQEKGVLQSYRSPNAAAIPANYKDPAGYWTGFAGRFRVLLVNTQRLAPERYPFEVDDLFNIIFPAAQVGMANPLFGTALTHAAAIYAVRGRDPGKAFYRVLQQRGIQVLDGNSVVRDLVVSGQLAWGIVDSDDACGAVEKGGPVAIVIPDQKPPAFISTPPLGTLVIPNTAAIIAGAPHRSAARRLIDYLLRPETEQFLQDTGWSHLPLHPGLTPGGCFKDQQIIGMNLKIRDIYAQLQNVQQDITEIYIR